VPDRRISDDAVAFLLRFFKLLCDVIDRVLQSAAPHFMAVFRAFAGACAGCAVDRSSGKYVEKKLLANP